MKFRFIQSIQYNRDIFFISDLDVYVPKIYNDLSNIDRGVLRNEIVEDYLNSLGITSELRFSVLVTRNVTKVYVKNGYFSKVKLIITQKLRDDKLNRILG